MMLEYSNEGSIEYFYHCQLSTTHIGQYVEDYIGEYKLLSQVYTWLYKVTLPVENLLKKDVKFEWNEECNKSIETL